VEVGCVAVSEDHTEAGNTAPFHIVPAPKGGSTLTMSYDELLLKLKISYWKCLKNKEF
jgi:hypothetical protein